LEERLLDSHWRVARSQNLLDASRALRLQLDGIVAPLSADDIVRFVIGATGAAMMSFQRVEGSRLKLRGTHGFDGRFAAFFDIVDGADCACGAAMAALKRVVVADVETSPLFVGHESLEELRAAGVASCISTPVMRSDGSMQAMFSIH